MAREYHYDPIERDIAVSTNYNHIQDDLIELNHPKANDEEFILAAAKWSYRYYGFGCADAAGYLERLKARNASRLYKVDVREWYALRNTVFKRDNYTCAYCKKVGGNLECDHIIPYSKGGTNDLSNLTTSCRKCNRQKKNKSVEEFLIWRATR